MCGTILESQVMDANSLKMLIAEESLPQSYVEAVNNWYVPLAEEIAALPRGGPLLIGIQGSQGSGKSTLALFLRNLLEQDCGLRCVILSLDDFYKTRAERQQLAESVHPLLQTRGVPGTHDVDLANAAIDALTDPQRREFVHLPRFNKATDDRMRKSIWTRVYGKVDIILFEGWCVGLGPQSAEQLQRPVNMLEANEDRDGVWRNYVNDALANEYQTLFARLDKLLVMQAPSFECVYEWRWLQEQKLMARWQLENPDQPARLLDAKSISRFIAHYERLTRHCLATLPETANWLLKLNPDHEIYMMTRR